MHDAIKTGFYRFIPLLLTLIVSLQSLQCVKEFKIQLAETVSQLSHESNVTIVTNVKQKKWSKGKAK